MWKRLQCVFVHLSRPVISTLAGSVFLLEKAGEEGEGGFTTAAARSDFPLDLQCAARYLLILRAGHLDCSDKYAKNMNRAPSSCWSDLRIMASPVGGFGATSRFMILKIIKPSLMLDIHKYLTANFKVAKNKNTL
jgi:hypothetical protein